MYAVEDFARHLRQVHARAGAPSWRQLALRTGYGKSTIAEAFAGRRLPTWPLVEKLAAALGVDQDELQERWAAAKGGPAAPVEPVPSWLTSVRADIPHLITGMGLEAACTAAARDPERAMSSAWEVLRVSALQLAHKYYGDTPGSWSSNIVQTYNRAENDGRLPAGVTAVANAVHHHHVSSKFHPPELPSTAELLQIVVLAYRLAWQARDLITEGGR